MNSHVFFQQALVAVALLPVVAQAESSNVARGDFHGGGGNFDRGGEGGRNEDFNRDPAVRYGEDRRAYQRGVERANEWDNANDGAVPAYTYTVEGQPQQSSSGQNQQYQQQQPPQNAPNYNPNGGEQYRQQENPPRNPNLPDVQQYIPPDSDDNPIYYDSDVL